ncbi:hypothetical protein Lgee_1611 [Legionella geestiana]|uniref:Uncharacterized protein n=1 Tax=Legionella geestiana TaxID=45065 RepID=A0A0W0TSP4_9GAMM|nr:hypothetical protein [Legionella geestiana]KTC98534.1 hypothetical protein Lgee_1611 [Legionella geestiana]QBS13064.1 hypothetical protein E4T54_10125 [Legionella geestiana]QDQ39255.1 hypothetical protein E3226_001945 [Legionella geestiana]STX54422.1 Uncharacterised protein [Legionella geestiana]
MKTWLLAVLCLLCASVAAGAPLEKSTGTLQADLYLSSTCEHCQHAQAFFDELAMTLPWLKVKRQFIDLDSNALKAFYEAQKQIGQAGDFAVPSIIFCDSRWVGFDTSQTTGKVLLHALNYCHEALLKDGKLTANTIRVLREWAKASRLTSSMRATQSVLPLTPALALVDAFVPCALFFFFGFLALLVFVSREHLPQRALWAAIITLGVTQFLQRSFSSWFISMHEVLRLIAVMAGVFLLTFLIQVVRAPVRRLRFLMPLVVLVSAMLSVFQQGCLFNPSLVFNQWLMEQGYSSGRMLLASLGYQLVYLLPLVLTWWFGARLLARTARIQPMLEKAGILYVYAIGAFLLVCPHCLSRFSLSFITLLLALAGGWWLEQRERQNG